MQRALGIWIISLLVCCMHSGTSVDGTAEKDDAQEDALLLAARQLGVTPCPTTGRPMPTTPMKSGISVNLVNGGAPNRGRVEITFQGRRTSLTFCGDSNLHSRETLAIVICRMLGYPWYVRSDCCNRYGRGRPGRALEVKGCNGRENSILECNKLSWKFCFGSHLSVECVPKHHCPVINGKVCGLHGDCLKNASAMHTCVCHSGYEWSSAKRDCVDANECKKGSHNCTSPAVCVNTLGSYRCKCPPGWLLDKRRCLDIDECKNSNVCGARAKCHNYPGGFRCKCKVGYRGSGKQPVCRDINECAEKSDRCPAISNCVNTIGSYKCNCKKGYEQVSQFKCREINECSRGIHGCRAHSKCVNTAGAWRCQCNKGWYPVPKGARIPVCKDVNECKDKKSACPKMSICVNTVGSYRCDCNRCYYKSGAKCKADCREVKKSYHYYVTTYYKTYYTTKCGFLNLKRCRRSRTKSRSTRKTGYRKVSVANRPGARCPCK